MFDVNWLRTCVFVYSMCLASSHAQALTPDSWQYWRPLGQNWKFQLHSTGHCGQSRW